jgi:hypothetical protein
MKQLFAGNPNKLREALWSLDLEPIMVKLMDPREGKGWPEPQAFKALEEYRRFLFLTLTRPEPIVPTTFVDTAWHAHILDTAKYRQDCENVFGFFLDHFPYFGMRSNADRDALDLCFRASGDIYKEVFGSSYHVNAAEHSAGNCTCTDCGGNACGTCAGSGIAKERMRVHERPTLEMYRSLSAPQ